MTSSYAIISSLHPASVSLVSLFLKQVNFIIFLGPLHLLSPLPGALCPRSSHAQCPLVVPVSSNVTSQRAFLGHPSVTLYHTAVLLSSWHLSFIEITFLFIYIPGLYYRAYHIMYSQFRMFVGGMNEQVSERMDLELVKGNLNMMKRAKTLELDILDLSFRPASLLMGRWPSYSS